MDIQIYLSSALPWNPYFYRTFCYKMFDNLSVPCLHVSDGMLVSWVWYLCTNQIKKGITDYQQVVREGKPLVQFANIRKIVFCPPTLFTVWVNPCVVRHPRSLKSTHMTAKFGSFFFCYPYFFYHTLTNNVGFVDIAFAKFFSPVILRNYHIGIVGARVTVSNMGPQCLDVSQKNF